MMSQRSIGSRLWAGFAVFAVLVGAAAAFVLIGASGQQGAIRELTGQVHTLQVATGQLEEDFITSALAASNYSLTGDRAFLPAYRHARADFTIQLAKMRRLAPSDLLRYVNAQQGIGADWFNLASVAAALPHGISPATWLTEGASVTIRLFIEANAGLQQRLAVDIRRLTAQSRRSFGIGLAASGGVLGIAMTLALVAALGTLHGITGPLRRLTATLGRLAAGDHAARAEVAAAAEIRHVALSVNALADESDRLRGEEQEHSRLRAMAREAGIRVRENLRAEEVTREACAAIAQGLDSDRTYLRLVRGDRLGPAEGNPEDLPLLAGPPADLPADAVDWARDLLMNHASLVIQDLGGPDGDRVPTHVREPLLRGGVVSQIVTPFGSGSEVFGIAVAQRANPGRQWTAAEIDAFESIAADIGRGLNHARLYEKENHLVEELKSLDRAKSDFLATVSHELRTPLTSIASYVELLRDQDAGPVTAEQDRMLETVDRNATRLRNLIEDVLTLSKIESGAFKTVLQPVNLAELIIAAMAALQPTAAAKEITLTSPGPGDDLIVNGDASQLDRVLINLISNAVKFTPKGGAICLTAGRDGEAAAVSVRDTGIGIPERDKKTLFTRFFRASNAVKQAIPGTGLGLTIVHTIMINHGGEIELQSQEGQGTTVTLHIPLAAAPDPARD
jgi:two-component system, OmpR family, phosphate regulon sensor histidine kinase PhoR